MATGLEGVFPTDARWRLLGAAAKDAGIETRFFAVQLPGAHGLRRYIAVLDYDGVNATYTQALYMVLLSAADAFTGALAAAVALALADEEA